MAPNDDKAWNTLGVAQFRHGDYQNSVTSLNKAIYINQEANGHDYVFLAMAHWQLGDHELAADCYNKADRWMQKHMPVEPELQRFGVEAARLLRKPAVTKDHNPIFVR